MQFVKKLFSSLIIAFSFLTCIPVPFLNKINYEEKNISLSLVYYPIIGLFFGLVLYYTVQFFSFLKINISIISITVVFLPYLINKFLHFDGLCDTIDAFLPNKSPEERLKILKDTNIGSYAIGIIILFILLKLELVKILLNNNLMHFIIVIPVFSRYSLVLLSFISRYPRKQGTAFNIIGKISFKVFLASTIFFIVINSCFLIIFFNFNHFINIIILIFFIFIFSLTFKIYSDHKINGVTGDILGTQNELIEFFSIIIIIILTSIK